jgi:hypothetical protein
MKNHRLIYPSMRGKKYFCHFQSQRLTVSMLALKERYCALGSNPHARLAAAFRLFRDV